ncbi:FG-GAP repeat domain-containing protein [Virgibacillus halodenitrificans]|uniref:VCBS repeat-containing protein n=1 Tax=Virgibacillus halodenitrificans TaxID=1482 RepID=A0ABR7VJP8_VIRHA|nr:VCBS repeat-containing protein [Virgibacillus halodenitrificans]MBD1222151.1 VCBS repeat-containing protein [Virgibacillus halodenitrificans]
MYWYEPYRVNQAQLVDSAYGDVNGDGTLDYVFITAVKAEASSPFLQDITLNIQDGATNRVYSIPLNKDGNSGYQPTVFLGDFTGDGIKDILVTIDSGGSGAFTFNYVYSFVNNQARVLFDFNKYNEQNTYSVTYLDYYKVNVYSPATGQAYIVDISNRDADYLSQIYDEKGILKQPVQGMFDGVSGFYPVDMDRDGVYEIQAYQKISGLYHADSFGYMINTLQWDKDKFSIWQQWMAIYGSEPSK